jgi:predicted nucleic acid-binding protein
MSDVVVDSSVVAKWVLPEPDDAQAKHLMASVLGRGDRLLSLDLAFAEVANAIWSRCRRRMIDLTAAERSLRDLLTSPIDAEPTPPLLEDAFRIATKYDRAIYDALFVALALKRGLQGITADEPLYNAVHGDFPLIVRLRDWK